MTPGKVTVDIPLEPIVQEVARRIIRDLLEELTGECVHHKPHFHNPTTKMKIECPRCVDAILPGG